MQLSDNMKIFLASFLLAGTLSATAQTNDKPTIDLIYKNALSSKTAYQNLQELCAKAPGRLVGSPQSEIAIKLLKAKVDEIHPDSSYLQAFNTISWRPKTPAQAILKYKGKTTGLNVAYLGLSGSAPVAGVEAGVLEIQRMTQLDSLGEEKVKGKIVFFNRPMNNGFVNTFEAYGDAIDQRSIGATKASKLGAVGVLVRSLATELDDYPHSGVSKYRDGVKEVPNFAISTNDAEKLSAVLKSGGSPKVFLKGTTEKLDNVHTANVIAELRGSEHPEKIILIGGHMDAWFNTPGAHDDGAGCVQMMDVLRIFRELHIKPKNTIRLVLFMDEEMYQSGGKAYVDLVGKENKQHIACIESDAGAALPTGFELNGSEANLKSLKNVSQQLSDFGVFEIIPGYGGVDIDPLKKYGFPLIGLLSSSQRYFEYHHSANDTPDKVSRREMQMGTASVASLVYLIDKYGL